MRYDIYWGPRKLDTVIAKSKEDAIRKAPLPWREENKGELYALPVRPVKGGD